MRSFCEFIIPMSTEYVDVHFDVLPDGTVIDIYCRTEDRLLAFGGYVSDEETEETVLPAVSKKFGTRVSKLNSGFVNLFRSQIEEYMGWIRLTVECSELWLSDGEKREEDVYVNMVDKYKKR